MPLIDAVVIAVGGCDSPISTASPSPPVPAASPACGSGSRPRAASALAADKPVVGLTTLAVLAAPSCRGRRPCSGRRRDRRAACACLSVVVRRGGRMLMSAAHRRIAGGRARHGRGVGAAGRLGRAHDCGGLARSRGSAADRRAPGARHRLGCAARRRRRRDRRRRPSRSICARRTPSRRRRRSCRADETISRPPVRAPAAGRCRKRRRATQRPSQRCMRASFRRGWSEDEVEALLIDRNVLRIAP